MNPVWHFVNGVPQVGPLTIGTAAVTSTVPVLGPDSGQAFGFPGDPDSYVSRGGADIIDITVGGGSYLRVDGATGTILRSGTALQFAGSGVGSVDVSLSRPAANRLQLATGDVMNLAPTAFASLPTGAEGDLAFVTDSNTATPGATVAAGGANNILAFFNGTNWICA